MFSKYSTDPVVAPLIQKISEHIVTPIVGVLFIASFVVFLWGVFGMIRGEGDSETRTTGQRNILWGTIGMAVMLSVFGIIRLIAATVGVEDPFL
ncbi:MAG: hypothetical protein V4697_02945 [Patescibacteria group bacterium]